MTGGGGCKKNKKTKKQNTLGGVHPFVWLQDSHPQQHGYKSAARPRPSSGGRRSEGERRQLTEAESYSEVIACFELGILCGALARPGLGGTPRQEHQSSGSGWGGGWWSCSGRAGGEGLGGRPGETNCRPAETSGASTPSEDENSCLHSDMFHSLPSHSPAYYRLCAAAAVKAKRVVQVRTLNFVLC